MLIRPLPYFLKWHFPAKGPAPGLARIKSVQGVEEVALGAEVSKNSPAPQPYLTRLIAATAAV